jgi:hypothetical protein
MYQPWATGRHLIIQFTFNSTVYSFCIQCNKDVGDSTTWYPWVCTGDWTAAQPLIIMDMQNAFMSAAEESGGKTPEQYVAFKITKMNEYFTDYFKGVTPVSWEQQVEVLLQGLQVSIVGIPQVK